MSETFESEARMAGEQYHAVTKTALINLRRAERALAAAQRAYNQTIDREARIYKQTIADLQVKYPGDTPAGVGQYQTRYM